MCHYCGKSKNYSDKCSNCGCEQIKYTGIGTQKAEEELKEWIDKEYEEGRQTTLANGEIEEKIEEFSCGKFKRL